MYKIKKANKKDYKKSIIEKQDTVEFTLENADRQQREYEKYKTEWEAQVKLCNATIANLRRNHPDVLRLSETKLIAAKMYLENKEVLAQYNPKLKELNKVMKEYVKERKTIMERFNWRDETPETK